jgi:hypothetical protein
MVLKIGIKNDGLKKCSGSPASSADPSVHSLGTKAGNATISCDGSCQGGCDNFTRYQGRVCWLEDEDGWTAEDACATPDG